MFRPSRVGAVLVGLIALLFLVAGEFGLPGVFELAFAALLLGFGLAAATPRCWNSLPEAPSGVSQPRLDPQEQVRRQVRLLERRRSRCLETLLDVQRCAAAEQEVGRPTERLEAATEALSAALAAFDAGIAREQAAGLALRVTHWMNRLPSLAEGLERLDHGACRHRLERLEAAARNAEALAAELREHPAADEEPARRALALLEAGQEELSRFRVDLLARTTALITGTVEGFRLKVEGQTVARPSTFDLQPSTFNHLEAALERSWDWLCRTAARRELNHWASASAAAPTTVPEPVTILLPRGRDLGMLPFSLILLGFTTAHASLAVSTVAPISPVLLLPMAGFYALFLFPGVQLFREAVRARRREELTLCGSAVMLRWRWALWEGVETVVVAPDAPVRRDEVAHSGDQPIRRLCLQGIDGRKLHFGFGLSDAQHAQVIRKMGRPATPMLPDRLGDLRPVHRSADDEVSLTTEQEHDSG